MCISQTGNYRQPASQPPFDRERNVCYSLSCWCCCRRRSMSVRMEWSGMRQVYLIVVIASVVVVAATASAAVKQFLLLLLFGIDIVLNSEWCTFSVSLLWPNYTICANQMPWHRIAITAPDNETREGEIGYLCQVHMAVRERTHGTFRVLSEK